MRVQLINEMKVTTNGGYQVKYEANEELDLHKDKEDNLLIVDDDKNAVKVDDEEIFEAVMSNVRYGKKREGTAKVSLKKVLEEVDPELVADFMAATNQVPNESAEKGAEEHKDSEEGGLDKLEIDIPVTVVDDAPISDKVDVLMKEEAFEDIEPDTLKDMEVRSVELVDDAPAFTKNQDNSEDAKDIDENEGKNDPDVPAIDEEPNAEGEEFFEAVVNVKRMREEVELSINPEGGIDIVAGKTSTDMISDDEEFIEPELGAAGVDAPVEDEPTDEPVINEESEEGEAEGNPVKNPEDEDDKDDALDHLLDEPMGECNK